MEKNSEKAGRIIRIGITGPESSGKTWLAQRLAAEFNDCWLPEYAREYLSNHEGSYDISDLDIIAHEQLRRETEYIQRSKRILFCDTDAVVLKIWYEFKFGVVPSFIEEALQEKRYDLHFLMTPDIPYEEDPLRENPERGMFFFEKFRETLLLYELPFKIIAGSAAERIKKAGEEIRQLPDFSPA